MADPGIWHDDVVRAADGSNRRIARVRVIDPSHFACHGLERNRSIREPRFTIGDWFIFDSDCRRRTIVDIQRGQAGYLIYIHE